MFKPQKLLYIIILTTTLYLILINGFSIYVSATNISGHITQDTTWTVENSPYILNGDVVIDSGVTLTIEAGVEIRFSSGSRLIVNGFLHAYGDSTEKNNIYIIIEQPRPRGLVNHRI